MGQAEGGTLLVAGRKTNKNESSGFTLVEVLVILIIAGILTLLVANIYFRAAQRNRLQGEAIAMLTRIEQARALAQSQVQTAGQIQGTEYRVRFNPTISGSPCGCYVAEFYDRTLATPAWVTATAVNSAPVTLNRNIRFGLDGRSPAIAAAPPDQPASTLTTPSAEFRFNSRGFPVDTTAAAPPSAPTQVNAVYINDGVSTFAVTVNILGRVQIWAGDQRVPFTWVAISR